VIFGLVIYENFWGIVGRLVIIVIGVAIVVFLNDLFERRPKFLYETLRKDRRKDNYQAFRKIFIHTNINILILRTVYLHIGYEAHVPIRPSDHVFKDLRLPRFDFKWDLLPSIVWNCGKTMRSVRTNPYYANRHRIEGMVKFIHHQPERQKGKSFASLLNKMYLWDDEQREEEIRYLQSKKQSLLQKRSSGLKKEK
jgi:hypothetical protein